MTRVYLSLMVLYFGLLKPATSGCPKQTESVMKESLKGMVYTQHLLFEGPVPSPLRCAQICASLSSVALTFTDQESTPSLCRCHSEAMDASSDNVTSAGSVTSVRKDGLTGRPCVSGMHTELRDDWRAAPRNYGGTPKCDKDLPGGWYRFFLHGSSAVMPTHCVEEYSCHTLGAQWLDLEGQCPPAVGKETKARVCGSLLDSCCITSTPATVRNYGSFYVYKLEPYSNCEFAHCAEPQE